MRFLAELTDGDPPLLRARCAELDLSIAIDTGAFVRPDDALVVLVADAVAGKVAPAANPIVAIDMADRDPADRPRLLPVTRFSLREYLALLIPDRRDRALAETEAA